MYSAAKAWRPIDNLIKRDVSVAAPVRLSRLVLVRLSKREAPARWRHAFERYNSATGAVIQRQGAWWTEQGRVLEFEPTEYRDL
jgi:hypothetical protein